MRLHEQVKQLEAEKLILVAGISELRRYLNSAKFGEDVMVNKNDILLRLNELDNELTLEEIKRN